MKDSVLNLEDFQLQEAGSNQNQRTGEAQGREEEEEEGGGGGSCALQLKTRQWGRRSVEFARRRSQADENRRL